MWNAIRVIVHGMVSKLLRICSGDQTSHIQGVAPHRVGGYLYIKIIQASQRHRTLSLQLSSLISFITHSLLTCFFSFFIRLFVVSFAVLSSLCPRLVSCALPLPCPVAVLVPRWCPCHC